LVVEGATFAEDLGGDVLDSHVAGHCRGGAAVSGLSTVWCVRFQINEGSKMRNFLGRGALGAL
jgi:hypothetical protein